jgi:hypothetical protein
MHNKPHPNHATQEEIQLQLGAFVLSSWAQNQIPLFKQKQGRMPHQP